MTDHLIDTNVLAEVFRGNSKVKEFIESLESSIDTTVYVECIQGSKSNREKRIIKKYLSHFPIYYHTPEISKWTIALIEKYSNSHGLLLPDAQIAAVCVENNLTLLTYNVSDFHYIQGLECLKPLV